MTKRVLHVREVLRNRQFRKLFLANLFSGCGQGMTMIGISWYLVESTGSAGLLGTTMLISSILTLLVAPYSGTLIDRFSRKAILQLEQLGGFVVLACLAAWGFWGDYQPWMMVLIFLASLLLFQLHEPTQAAFVQETFAPKQYHAINSLLEIENQTALVLAGALAGLLLESYGLHIVLLLNALTYLVAFWLMTGIEYVSAIRQQTKKSHPVSWVEQFRQSWVYIKERRGFLTFGTAALMPFIAVMLANLLNPVFVSQTLREDVKIYSLGEVTYSAGAVAAGMLILWIQRKWGAYGTMLAHYAWMAFAFILTVALPSGWMFILLSAIMGWCNVSTRLIRQTMYMEMLPNRLIGRVMSFFKSVGTLMRLLLLALFTTMTDSIGPAAGYLVLAGLLLAAMLGVAVSMPFLMRQAVAAEE